MPSCVQLGASDFGSTSDLADPEDMPILRYRVLPSKFEDDGTRGSYASSSMYAAITGFNALNGFTVIITIE